MQPSITTVFSRCDPVQSYPVCQGAPPAPEPSRLYEAPDHKRSRNHRTLSDREKGSLAPGGHTHLKHCFSLILVLLPTYP